MFTLVIADIHENVDWIEKVISQESPDEVIFLGDYFDSFTSTKETVKETIDWFLYSINQPNRHHCYGNHDTWYAFPQTKGLVCSGNTLEKQQYIAQFIKRNDWNKLILFCKSQNFYFSHGGMLSENFLHPINGFSDDFVTQQCNHAIELARTGVASPLLRAGMARGGSAPVAGITWVDFNHEFKPIANINQIVGHTPFNSPDDKKHIKYRPNKKYHNSINYCVDFKGRFYTTIIDGKVNYEPTGSENNRYKHKLIGEPNYPNKSIRKINNHTYKIECSVCGNINVKLWTEENGVKKYFCSNDCENNNH